MSKWIAICCGVLMSSAVLAAVNTREESRKFQQFELKVPDVTLAMLYPDYWINLLKDPDLLLMTEAEITTYNRRQFAAVPTLVELNDYPETLEGTKLLEAIDSISSTDGKELTPEVARQLTEAANRRGIHQQNPVRWGLIVNRSNVRTFPTRQSYVNPEMDSEVDLFQETCLFIGEPVAILHTSGDGQWFLVQSYNYLGWIPILDVAVGDRQTVLNYKNAEDVLVMTGAKVETAMVPDDEQLSLRCLEMGSRYPLSDEVPDSVNGMSPYSGFVIRLPVRNADGTLQLNDALVSRSADVNIGYLPYTRRELIRQLFKFLGERYGWGHGNLARDCSGYVNDVFKVFGLVLPRNGGEQQNDAIGLTFDFGKLNLEERVALLKTMLPGDVLFTPGHVMVYLGTSADGEPFMIHDTIGIAFMRDDVRQSLELRGVSVTPVVPLLAGKRHYLEFFQTGRRFVLPDAAGENRQ